MSASDRSTSGPRIISAGNVQWELLPDWEQMLLGPGGLRLDEWLSQGRAKVLKHGSQRTVYRVDLAGRAFYLKHYRSSALWAAGRDLVRASASRREYRKAVEVARRRVPTVTPVAVGERVVYGLVRDHYFVTEAIPHASALDEYMSEYLPRLEPAAQARMRRKLALALARLCAASHRGGIYHNDFHIGNVLVRVDTCHPGPSDHRLPRLHLIDLAGVRLSRPLAWSRSRDSLGMLSSAWSGLASASDRWRFWRAYLAERPDLALPDPRQAAIQIARQAARHARRTIRSRDKRALGTNRDFYALVVPGAVGHAVRELPVAQLLSLLADPEHPLRANRHRPVKLSHRSVVVEAELPLAGVPARVAYKRMRVKNWWKSLAARFRRSHALAGWYLGHALRERGIATARPVAVCEPRPFGRRSSSYLATQWIDGAQNLHLYGWQLAGYPPNERRRRTRQCAASLGRLLGRMHAWQIADRDLKGCNLVVVELEDRVLAYLIDLAGVRMVRGLRRRTRARNLARLAASLEAHPWLARTDRLRFLRAYLRELAGGPPAAGDWKALWREVAALSRKIIGRLRRRGRAVV